jgi:UDP-N-acetylmuramate dehydrogenase
MLLTKDYEGLIIALRLKGITEEKADENHILVTAKAGENWHQFVLYCISKNYGGLENLSLIPGNVGTSPIQNIGAYGTEIKDTFHSCKVLDTEDFSVKTLNLKDCHFGYRDFFQKYSKRTLYYSGSKFPSYNP